MKYEIEIELPEHLRDKWRPVAFRDAMPGEWVLMHLDGPVRTFNRVMKGCLIVEPIDPRDEIKKWWPKSIGFDWITRDETGVWGWFGTRPYLLYDEFQNKENEQSSVYVGFELSEIIAPELSNVADQVWANPWKEQQ